MTSKIIDQKYKNIFLSDPFTNLHDKFKLMLYVPRNDTKYSCLHSALIVYPTYFESEVS